MSVRAQAQAAPEAVEHEQAEDSAQCIEEGMKKGIKKISKHYGTSLGCRTFELWIAAWIVASFVFAWM
jgi:hypothetical protein